MSLPKISNPTIMSTNKNDLEERQTKNSKNYFNSIQTTQRRHGYAPREREKRDKWNKEVNTRNENNSTKRIIEEKPS